MEPNKKPPPHNVAAMQPTNRGPTSSNHFPAIAADRPKHTIDVEKIGTTACNDQSLALEQITPSSLVKGSLNNDHAYTLPMDKCVPIAAGGTNQRLNDGDATIDSLNKDAGKFLRKKSSFLLLCGDDDDGGGGCCCCCSYRQLKMTSIYVKMKKRMILYFYIYY